MKYSKTILAIEEWLTKFFFTIGVILAVCGIIYTCTDHVTTTTPLVEESSLDSLIIANDNLIIEVETLDSIKDAKVIKVKSLDNDSTLKLFYQLIRK